MSEQGIPFSNIQSKHPILWLRTLRPKEIMGYVQGHAVIWNICSFLACCHLVFSCWVCARTVLYKKTQETLLTGNSDLTNWQWRGSSVGRSAWSSYSWLFCFQDPSYPWTALINYYYPHLAVLRSCTPTLKLESKLYIGCLRGWNKHRKLHANCLDTLVNRQGFSIFAG